MADWYRTTENPAEHNGLIVDLREHAERLLEYDDISSLLTSEQEDKIVQYVRMLMRMSYDAMRHRYPHWDEADRAHDVYVDPDATQFREKAVISTTRAINDTVVTYLMAALTGRNPMYQLEGEDPESRKGAAIVERVLHSHMRKKAGEARMIQLFQDATRYGMAPTRVFWDTKESYNHLYNWNPRRVYPDPRVSWGDWDRSQFIGLVDYTTYDALLMTGEYPKLKEFPALRHSNAGKTASETGWEVHKYSNPKGRGFSIDPTNATRNTNSDYFQINPARAHDVLWVRLPGWQLGLDGIEMLWLCISILDESVVIKFRLSPDGKQFPIINGGLFFDQHKTLSQSLYDLLLPMHDIMTWLLRSRVDNVQAALNNLVFVDPTKVNIMDLIDKNPYGIVTTLPGFAPGDGVKVHNVPDVTSGHWNDIGFMQDLQQRVSAASDAQQGVPTGDVRTATEIQRLTQLGSQRLGVLARVMSATTIRPMVHMMVGNIQDALEFQGSVRIGSTDTVPETIQPNVRDGYLNYGIDDVQGQLNYMVVDGTLPLEPTRSPETWLKMIQVANQAGLVMELDIKEMGVEAIRSMGVPDIDRFRLEGVTQPETPSQQLQVMEKMRGLSVNSNENIENEVQKGNLVPVEQAQGAR